MSEEDMERLSRRLSRAIDGSGMGIPRSLPLAEKASRVMSSLGLPSKPDLLEVSKLGQVVRTIESKLR
jgi:hypothetical protein